MLWLWDLICSYNFLCEDLYAAEVFQFVARGIRWHSVLYYTLFRVIIVRKISEAVLKYYIDVIVNKLCIQIIRSYYTQTSSYAVLFDRKIITEIELNNVYNKHFLFTFFYSAGLILYFKWIHDNAYLLDKCFPALNKVPQFFSMQSVNNITRFP